MTSPQARSRKYLAGIWPLPIRARYPWLAVAILLVSFWPIGYIESSVAAADAEQRQRLDALRTRIQGQRQRLEAKRGESTKLSRLLRESEQAIGRLALRLRALDGRLDRQRAELARLRAAQAAQRRSLDLQRRVLARQMRAAYLMGRQERLKILLNQQDPATVGRVMVYYDYLSQARAQKMLQIQADIQQLAQTEEGIQEQQRELAGLHDAQKRELSDLRRSQEKRQAVLIALTGEINDQDQQLGRLQSDERELQALLSGIEEALADIAVEHPQQLAFAGQRGRLSWPARGQVVKRFGAPRLGRLVWDGVMISAPEGQEVRAIHYGRVAFADWLRGFGLLVIVDHGDGFMTLYGHNQSLFKEAGDWVEVDEPIALVGSSGGRERSGVYFAIRHQGRPVDPSKWCRRLAGSKVVDEISAPAGGVSRLL